LKVAIIEIIAKKTQKMSNQNEVPAFKMKLVWP